MDRMTDACKTLPCRNYVADGKIISFSYSFWRNVYQITGFVPSLGLQATLGNPGSATDVRKHH